MKTTAHRLRSWRAISAFLTLYAPSVQSQRLATAEDLAKWRSTTESTVVYEDAGFWDAPVSDDHLHVIGCTERIGNTCGGSCLYYHGPRGVGCRAFTGIRLLVNCIAATHPISTCRGECNNCDTYANCATTLDDGFCSMPGGLSFIVSEVESVPVPQLPPPVEVSTSPTPSTQPPTTERRPDKPPTLNPGTSSSTPPSSSNVTSVSASTGPTPLSSSSKDGVSPILPINTGAASAPSAGTESQQSSLALPIGAIIGTAIGGLLIVITALLIIIWIRKHRSHQPVSANSTSSSPAPFSGLMQQVRYMPDPFQTPINSSATSSVYRSRAMSPSDGFSNTVDIIDHEHGGTRLTSPAGQGQSERAVVQHPPPYTNA